MGEVIHQIQHFKPDSKLVRQRIEGLIERECVSDLWSG
jgi:cullin 1